MIGALGAPLLDAFQPGILFKNVFGRDQVEELINGQWRKKPGAYEYWNNVIKECWGGSCSGLSITALLYFDNLRNLNTDFGPGWNNVFQMQVDYDGVRRMINTFQFYWFGQVQNYYGRWASMNKAPSQTLQDCIQMMQSSQRNDRYLYMADRSGRGAHAVVPYKVERDQNNQDLNYIYIYDCNSPNNYNKRIIVNTSTNGGQGRPVLRRILASLEWDRQFISNGSNES